MAAKKKSEKEVEIKAFKEIILEVEIEGTTDLILNKMNDVTAKALTDARKDKAKSLERPNYWEEVITSIHWRDGKPKEFTEESMKDALINNAPCITAFGLKKSFMNAVVRFDIETYSTRFKANVNMEDPNGLIPITFAEHFIDEKLMSPQIGKPILAKINRFTGWGAKFRVHCLDLIYSPEQIINIIRLAGFGMGIGSNLDAGYVRYEVKSVTVIG